MKIGFSVVDITPELGIYLTGYGMPERLAEGVHSPLNASVMVFEDGNTSAVVIGLDWCFVDWPLTQVIRKEINKMTGIPEQNIDLCCSHTHSAPHTTYMRTLPYRGRSRKQRRRLRPEIRSAYRCRSQGSAGESAGMCSRFCGNENPGWCFPPRHG